MMRVPVQARPPRPTEAAGVTARALLAHRKNQRRLNPADLELWLLESGLAVRDGAPGLLAPTRHAYELGGRLGFLG